MRNNSKSYHSIDENATLRRESTPWYWRLIALASSWMILGGYLILPGLYTKDYKLKISEAVLSVFVVAFLTAGYSFTALLCFACRNEMFQAEGVFLPALTSSAVGLLIVAYNLGVSNGFYWGNAAISGTVVSAIATVLYGSLLLWTHHRIVKKRQQASSRAANLWSEQSYYSNYVQNMYPTATPSPSHPAEPTLSEDERVNQQMALLLMKSDARPSPDANSATFRIDLPGQREEEERQARSQELIGSPGQPNPDWNRSRADSRPDSLSEQQAWEQSNRGRSADRPSGNSTRSAHSRNLSREERRREIELGRV